MCDPYTNVSILKFRSKKEGKDQESIQSSTTPDQGFYASISGKNNPYC